MIAFDIIIIGAGASGLMAAYRYKQQNIALLEVNAKIGQKIKISGGGKCNITNKIVSSKNYLGDEEFVQEILSNFSNRDLIDFFESLNLLMVIKKNNQYFCKNSSDDLLNIFQRELKNNKIFFNTKVLDVEKNNNFIITTNNGKFYAKHLVVASGGISYPSINASDIAFKIAKKFNHQIITPRASLVGFTVQKKEFWFKKLSGISIFAKVSVKNKSFLENILFTHKGVSGPSMLNASLYWQKGEINIDFLPNVSLQNLLKGSNRQISTIIPLPKRFLKEFLEEMNIEDKPINDLNIEEKTKLEILKNYSFSPAGNFGYTKAEVTSGGINTKEINVKNMMSNKCNNLYFLGECLNITGELGGYNFQFAFSSAMKLAIEVQKNLI